MKKGNKDSSFLRYSFNAFGTLCEVLLPTSLEPKASQAYLIVTTESLRIHTKYSRYLPESTLSQINAVAHQKMVILDAETALLLRFAQDAYELSGGLFDVTSGVLRRIWDFSLGRVPSEEERMETLKKVGWKKVLFSENKFQFSIPGMEIDLGGIGKEYALDRCATILQENEITPVLLNFGGDIRVVGEYPWKIGNPLTPTKENQCVVTELRKGALTTTGETERGFWKDGKRHSHILCPLTGRSISEKLPDSWSMVTILYDNALMAGVISTILFLLGRKASEVWAQTHGVIGWGVTREGKLCPFLDNPN